LSYTFLPRKSPKLLSSKSRLLPGYTLMFVERKSLKLSKPPLQRQCRSCHLTHSPRQRPPLETVILVPFTHASDMSLNVCDDFGFVDRDKLFSVESESHAGFLFVICAVHHEQTLQDIAQHIFDVHGALAERGDPNLPCPYTSHSSVVCSNDTAGRHVARLPGPFGDRAYHILSGDAFTCHCGLPF
jgi:hypothetical protein